MFFLHFYICVPSACDAHRGQRRMSNPLNWELKVLETKPESLTKLTGLLTAEPPLQPLNASLTSGHSPFFSSPSLWQLVIYMPSLF